MKTLTNLSLALMTACMLTGCIEVDEDENPNIGSTTEEVWTLGSNVTWVEWNSGKTSGLSSWKYITCNTTHRDASTRLRMMDVGSLNRR